MTNGQYSFTNAQGLGHLKIDHCFPKIGSYGTEIKVQNAKI